MRGVASDVLLAPVIESFLDIRKPGLDSGGFVVGSMGMTTAEELSEFAIDAGTRDKEMPHRFSFDPWLAGAIYDSHVSDGSGAFWYMGLIDEIEINNDGHTYRFPKMKPGEGTHGEEKYDERMPAFVRFRVLQPVAEVLLGHTHLWPKDLGLSETTLRKFKTGSVRKTTIREAFERPRLI